MTYHGVCNKSNTTDVTCGAELAYPPVEYEFIPVYCKVCVVRPLVFCLMFCKSLFVLLAIVLSVLQVTASDISCR